MDSRPRRASRIADGRYPLLDGAGARAFGGRWNSPGQAVVYAAESFALALLEVLVHANLGRVPRTQVVVEIALPAGIAIEEVAADALPGWDADDQRVSRKWGDAWLHRGRSAILLVPSLIASGHERNVLLNPGHPDFARLRIGMPEPVAWDARLFRS